MVRTASRTPKRCQISSRTAARLQSANGRSFGAVLQTVGRVAPDQVAGLRLLLGREEPAIPRLGPARTSLQPGRAPFSVALADVEHPGRAQADLRGDGIVSLAGLAQADHLPPAVGSGASNLAPPPAACACPRASCSQPGPILLALKTAQAGSIMSTPHGKRGHFHAAWTHGGEAW